MKLLKKIDHMFSDLQFPENELTRCDCGECLDIRKYFTKVNKLEIPKEKLVYFDPALCFFTPEAFRYFISAWLIADCDSKSGSTIVEQFCLSDKFIKEMLIFLRENK